MAIMSGVERWACCNPIWRAFTARAVIPWAMAGRSLTGECLELGAGSGANAAALLRRFPQLRLTATDLDPAMLAAARRRLAPFGSRAVVRPADAAQLDFADFSFDAVVSFLMLHHVGDWRAALRHSFRVLRPGGQLIGYDLTRSGPLERLHGPDDPTHNAVAADELRSALDDCGFSHVQVTRGVGGLVARFSATKY